MKSALLAAAAALTLAAAPRGYADVGEPEAPVPAPRHHVYHEDRYYVEPRPVYREEVRVYRYYRPVAVYPVPVFYPRPIFYGPPVRFLPPPPPRVHFFFGY
jgi:hypothetical protein